MPLLYSWADITVEGKVGENGNGHVDPHADAAAAAAQLHA